MLIAQDTFNFVRQLVLRESAIQLEPGKEYLVESRLMPLARQAGDADVNAYVRRLKQAPRQDLSKQIVEALTTNETSFFRDNEPFVALRKTILPEIAAKRSALKRIKLWSAACSSGQEVYSMAITVKDSPDMRGWNADFFATDLSSEMVERTRAGRFNQLEMNRGMPAPALVKYFVRDGVDWVANQELRSLVRVQEMNLNKPFPAIGNFDVIFLRNVLIYFDVPTKRAVLQRIRGCLAPDGFLVLGTAESAQGIDDTWERVPVGRTAVYRAKRNG